MTARLVEHAAQGTRCLGMETLGLLGASYALVTAITAPVLAGTTWFQARRTVEARNVAAVAAAVVWPVWAPLYLLIAGSKYVARGVRDLLPERSQTPGARVVQGDQHNYVRGLQ